MARTPVRIKILCLFASAAIFFASSPALAQTKPSTSVPDSTLFGRHLADYDAELRRADGRVDTDAMVTRLKELGVNTYYWLVWHARTDWDDLKLFLPKAERAGIQVWVYVVPPTESPPNFGTQYSEPFRLDYQRWAEEIAKLSLEHPNLTAWVIDDFYANREFFTPAYLREVQAKGKRINPKLALLPLMYFNEIGPKFVGDYRAVIDGVVIAYLQDRDEIERAWAFLNDATVPPGAELSYPWNTPSKAGEFLMVSTSAKVLPADKYILRFRQRDDFTGPTDGYHFKQLLIDGQVAWEQDVAGGPSTWQDVSVDVTQHARGKASVSVAFRLIDKKGVSNFGVHWQLDKLSADGLQLAADLTKPQDWRVTRQGAFETEFGITPAAGQRRFHIPFISMTAGDAGEFRLRHGDPATPQRIAEQFRLSLQAWRDGKCEGVVTYCLDKRPQSQTFPLVQKLLHEFANAPRATAATGPLRVHPTNPRYFADASGQAILLVGSHTWGNLQDYTYERAPAPPPMDFDAYLKFLKQHNHNFFRLWAWETAWNPTAKQSAIRYDPMPYLRTGPGDALDGKPKFDLNQFNPAYFSRIRQRIIAARDSGMYVSVMLFNGFSIDGKGNVGGDPWAGHPLNPKNNIQAFDGGANGAAHTLANPATTARQEAYIRKVIDTVNDLDNVLYEITNEDTGGPANTAWQVHMIRFIQRYEATRPAQHPVGMTVQYPAGNDAVLFDSPASWVSPAAKLPDGAGRKVIINDTDHSYFWIGLRQDGLAAQRAWVWQNFTRGNQCLFMDPYLDPSHDKGRNDPSGSKPDPYWDILRKAMGQTRAYSQRIDLANMASHGRLSSTGSCLANPGREYLVYAPNGEATLDLTSANGSFETEWMAADGRIAETGTIDGGAKRTFKAEFGGDGVLYVHRR